MLHSTENTETGSLARQLDILSQRITTAPCSGCFSEFLANAHSRGESYRALEGTGLYLTGTSHSTQVQPSSYKLDFNRLRRPQPFHQGSKTTLLLQWNYRSLDFYCQKDFSLSSRPGYITSTDETGRKARAVPCVCPRSTLPRTRRGWRHKVIWVNSNIQPAITFMIITVPSVWMIRWLIFYP